MAVYYELHRNGKLSERVEAARTLLESCRLCPRHATLTGQPMIKASVIPAGSPSKSEMEVK